MAEVGEHEEIVVGEDSTEKDITFFNIVMRIIYLNSTTYWIAGDVPLKGLLPSAKNNVLYTFVCMIYFCNRPWLCPR